MFCSMIDFDASLPHPVFMAEVYKQGIMTEILALKLMAPTYYHTRKILVSLKWFLEHLVLQCKRRSDRETAEDLELLLCDYVKPNLTITNGEKEGQTFDKEVKDTVKRNNLPPLDIAKQAAKQAMIDIYAISQYLHAGNKDNGNLFYAAHVAFAGLCYSNGHIVRPGSWVALRLEHCEEMFEKKLHYVVNQLNQ